jgi:hypothetical protein
MTAQTHQKGTVMENDRFDALTRTLSTADSRRRTLLGGVLGSVAATLGLGQGAAAKKKHQKGKKDRKRSGQVQAAGKKHKKHKRKDKRKPKKPKPLFCDVYCEEHGGRCCPDGGGCVEQGQCCPGQKRCPGYSECFAVDDCCPAVGHPPCGECEKLVCEGGELVCKSKCQGADSTCCHGSCVSTTCPPGQEFDSETCQCQSTVCPHGSPDVCSGTDPDDWQCGESESGFPCYCMRSTAGETHCSIPSWTYFPCVTDAECEQKYPGMNAFCNECNGTCYLNNDGCPGVGPA